MASTEPHRPATNMRKARAGKETALEAQVERERSYQNSRDWVMVENWHGRKRTEPSRKPNRLGKPYIVLQHLACKLPDNQRNQCC